MIDCLHFFRMYQLLNFWVFYTHNIFETVSISSFKILSFSSLMRFTVCTSVLFRSCCLAKHIALFISSFPPRPLEDYVLGFSAFILANLLVFLCSATDLSHSSRSRNFFLSFFVQTASYATSCHHQVFLGIMNSLAVIPKIFSAFIFKTCLPFSGQLIHYRRSL